MTILFVAMLLVLATACSATSTRLSVEDYSAWVVIQEGEKTSQRSLHGEDESFIRQVVGGCAWRPAEDVPQSEHQFELYRGEEFVAGQLYKGNIYVVTGDWTIRRCSVSSAIQSRIESLYAPR